LGSFRTPVPLPDKDPDASPTRTFTLNCEWLPYIRGALLQLILQYTWPQDDPAAVYLAQQRAMTLISMFDECATADLPFACPYTFESGQEGWFVIENDAFTSPLFGFYVAAEGFQNAVEVKNDDDSVWGYLYIDKVFSAENELTKVDVTYDLSKGTFTTDVTGVILLIHAGTTVASLTWSSQTLPDVTGGHKVWTGDVTGIDEIQVLFCANAYPAMSGYPGTVFIHSIDVEGKGTGECGSP